MTAATPGEAGREQFYGEAARAWLVGYQDGLADRGAALDQARRDGAALAADAIAAFRASRPGKPAAHYLAALVKAEEIARAAALAEQGDAG